MFLVFFVVFVFSCSFLFINMLFAFSFFLVLGDLQVLIGFCRSS